MIILSFGVDDVHRMVYYTPIASHPDHIMTSAHTPTQKVRLALAERISGFPLIGGPTHRHVWPFADSDEQRHQRAKLEAAMRGQRLAGLPGCFGGRK